MDHHRFSSSRRNLSSLLFLSIRGQAFALLLERCSSSLFFWFHLWLKSDHGPYSALLNIILVSLLSLGLGLFQNEARSSLIL
ncbi:hypothetical protein V8F20_002976 [Naviculisporaceae sp. PSN 640]